MGFYPQPNLWQCGPFALKHALGTLGVFANEKQISRIAGTNWWYGTDEIQLARAARHFNATLDVIRRFDAAKARKELHRYLQKGIPCLLCIQEWQHWVTVVKVERGRYVVLDSRVKEVLTIQSWRELQKAWVYHERDDVDRKAVQTIYDFHPVVPKFRVLTKARFSIARTLYLRRRRNRFLARHMEQYVTDLMNLCSPRTPLSSRVITLGEFLRRHEAMIVDQVGLWHRWASKSRARRVLSHIHFVADTYGLVIHLADEKRAIAGLTAILSLWAAAEYGVPEEYTPPVRSR